MDPIRTQIRVAAVTLGRMNPPGPGRPIPGLELRVDASRVPWRETSSPGVRWYLVGAPGEGRGSARESTVLIEMAPGHGYPAHRHLGVEEVLVLAGGYRDEQGEYRAGDHVRYEPGSVHAPLALGRADRPVGPENPACLLYAIARAGVEVLDGAPADR